MNIHTHSPFGSLNVCTLYKLYEKGNVTVYADDCCSTPTRYHKMYWTAISNRIGIVVFLFCSNALGHR